MISLLNTFNTLMTSFNRFLLCLYIGLSINDLIKTCYPEEHQRFIFNISYNSIYCYSKMQIIIQNIQSNLSESIKPFAFFNKNINSENIIEVILEGKVITKICKNNID